MKVEGWKTNELECLDCCPICGKEERDHLCNVEDWLGGTPGTWNYYKCRNCGIFYIDPRPRPESIGKLYEKYFTHNPTEKRQRRGLGKLALAIRNDYLNWKYGYSNIPALSGGHWLMYLLPPWFRWEWDHAARHLPAPEAGRNKLLDIGCGNGEFLAAAKTAGWHCVGVDFDNQAATAARSLGVEVHVGNLDEQNFEDASFDAITLSAVIEHVHDPIALLQTCERLIRSSGSLWILTPNIYSFVYYWFREKWLHFVPDHLILFTPRTLENILESLGFNVYLEHRGAHMQAHWRASSARKTGLKGADQVCLPAFLGRKSGFRYQPLEAVVALFPVLQGDIVIRAIKE